MHRYYLLRIRYDQDFFHLHFRDHYLLWSGVYYVFCTLSFVYPLGYNFCSCACLMATDNINRNNYSIIDPAPPPCYVDRTRRLWYLHECPLYGQSRYWETPVLACSRQMWWPTCSIGAAMGGTGDIRCDSAAVSCERLVIIVRAVKSISPYSDRTGAMYPEYSRCRGCVIGSYMSRNN